MWHFPYPASPEPKVESPPPRNLIPFFPDEVAVNILARVPRSHHSTLSLVSKRIRSLINSPDFFNTRSLIRRSQYVIYLTLRSFSSSNFQWFALHPNPFLLHPLPPLPVPTIGSAYVVLGHNIYVIGGSVNDIPCPNFWFLDCRKNRWYLGPPMYVSREFAAAGVIDGKIYVLGGCASDTFTRLAYWCEVYDPDLGKWDRALSSIDMRAKWMHASAVLNNKLYAMGDCGGISFDPRRGKWGRAGMNLDVGWRGKACVVDEILYCYDFMGSIQGYDANREEWMELKGVSDVLPPFLCGATMAEAGGNLIVVWESQGTGKEIDFMCAEIHVIKNNPEGELWGEINWMHKVLSAPECSTAVHCSAIEL